MTITAPTSAAGTSAPTTTATLNAFTSGYIATITVTNGGAGYSTAPTVTITRAAGDTTGINGAATSTISPPTGGQIDYITLSNSGSGYTSDPTVSITGGSGASGITARSAQTTSAGRVFVLTAMAQTVGNSRAISQMEVATPPSFPFSLPGALTIDAPSPHVDPANSNSYWINGNDANSCGETPIPPKASVGVTDNPDAPSNPSAVACITSTLGGAPNASCPAGNGVKVQNYVGDKASPDVENVYNSLGDLVTPAGCDALATAIAAKANYTYTGNFTCNNQSTCQIHYPVNSSDCPTYLINGNLTIGPGNPHLCGVLLVTGSLTMQGDYTWDGPIFVIGASGTFTGGGGGNGTINGSLFVAQDKNSDGTIKATLGTPTVSFQISGGGGNGIYYDHCKSDNMLRALNLGSITPVKSLQVLSVRTIY